MLGLNNNKGITLIELIIVLALLAVIVQVGYNFLTLGIFSFRRQTDNISNQTNIRLALKDISKEIRRVESIDLITIIKDESIQVGEITYSFEKDTNELLKNEEKFIGGIESFNPELKEGNKIVLKLTTLANSCWEIVLSTPVYLRE